MTTVATTMNLNALRSRYAKGLRVSQLVESLLDPLARSRVQGVWIHCLDDDALLARARELDAAGPADKPLFGIPFAVKDNIDVAGLPTTLGLASRAGAIAARDAGVVARLRAAGAVIVGKTALDEGTLGTTVGSGAGGAVGNAHRAGVIAGGSSA